MAAGEATRKKRSELGGKETGAVDDRGRLFLSKEKKDILGDNFVMTIGPVGAIFAYPDAEWDKFLDKLKRYSPMNQARQDYERFIFGQSDFNVKFEGNRVVIPAFLRKEAGVTGDVVVLGCNERIEIWAADEYGKYITSPREYNKDRRAMFKEFEDAIAAAEKEA